MKSIDSRELIKLMMFRPTLKDVAIFFNCSEDTIERKIKSISSCTFSEFKEHHTIGLKQKLQNKALEMAMNGNTAMMIFCLKNICGWEDRPQVDIKNQDIVIKIDSEDLLL